MIPQYPGPLSDGEGRVHAGKLAADKKRLFSARVKP